MPSMVIITLVLATFAIYSVHMQEPPPSSDPNCNKMGDTSNVYTSCTFTCEGDEIIVLQSNEPCFLPGKKRFIRDNKEQRKYRKMRGWKVRAKIILSLQCKICESTDWDNANASRRKENDCYTWLHEF
uniref:Mucin n=1 Tax=Rhipicephalus zambeziensis TaxID=60191 RepID=A0A224YM45_9ACAR